MVWIESWTWSSVAVALVLVVVAATNWGRDDMPNTSRARTDADITVAATFGLRVVCVICMVILFPVGVYAGSIDYTTG